MSLKENIEINWRAANSKQKWFVAAILAAVVIFTVSGWLGWLDTYLELREIRAEKAAAEKEADRALRAAAKIAAEIRVKEKNLANKEAKRDEKETEVNDAKSQVERDRARYDDAVGTDIGEAPSADKLCSDLEALGYPCR